jgi:hypothetical protein
MRESSHPPAGGGMRAPPATRWSVGAIVALLLLSPVLYELVAGGAR